MAMVYKGLSVAPCHWIERPSGAKDAIINPVGAKTFFLVFHYALTFYLSINYHLSITQSPYTAVSCNVEDAFPHEPVVCGFVRMRRSV